MRILYISSIDYRFAIKQRPQYFAELLSQWHNIDFLSFTDWYALSQIIKGKQKIQSLNTSKNTSNNLHIYFILRLPLNRWRIVFYINNLIKKYYFQILLKKNRYDYIIITNPIDYALLTKNTKSLIVYDCIDKMDTFIKNKKLKVIINCLEEKLTKEATFVTCVSKALQQFLSQYKQDVFLIKNGVNLELYQNIKFKDFGLDPQIKKIGFIGAIGDWVDVNLINEAAKKLQNIQFYWIGPLITNNANDLVKNKNTSYLGVYPAADIPALIQNLDICLLPFKLSNTAKYANPVKVYEYLALGKPVLARYYPELKEEFGDLIYYYQNKQEFIELAHKILSKQESPDLIEERKQFARNNSWQMRVQQFNNLLQSYRQ